MKFTQIFLAAPFAAGVFSAPATGNDDKAACESQKGMFFAVKGHYKGQCIKVGKLLCTKKSLLKWDKNTKEYICKSDTKKINKVCNKKCKKNKKNKKSCIKKCKKQEEKKEQEKNKKLAKKEADKLKRAARIEWGAANNCTDDGFEVLGNGDSKPFGCYEKCVGDTPFRCWETMQCHDCTIDTLGDKADFYALVTADNGTQKCKKDNKLACEAQEGMVFPEHGHYKGKCVSQDKWGCNFNDEVMQWDPTVKEYICVNELNVM